MSAMVIVGGYPLTLLGWTSQNHHLYEVAALPGIVDLGGDKVVLTRSAAKMKTLRQWVLPDAYGPAGLSIVHPVMAIADAIMAHQFNPSDSTWLAGPEDIDPDAIERSFIPDLSRALLELGCGGRLMDEIIELYEPVLDPESGLTPPQYRR